MIQKKELIQFEVQNRTDCGFDVPIFEFNVFSVNSTTKYSWDVTTADLSCGYGTLVVNGSTYNLTFTPTLSGLLISLNALGFGFFCSETIGGSTFIYTYDDTNVYGDLDLCAVPASTTTTTSTTTSTTTLAPTTTTTTTTTTTIAPTTTTSTTTTTTTASLQYLTDQYVCGTCTLLANNVVVQSNFSLDTGDYFIGEDGNVYQILGTTSGVPVTNISDNTAYVDCPSVPCPATTTTTTTTTTTLAPTTTSTTTTTTTLAPTTTSTTTTTTTSIPFLNMSLGASYTGVSEMLIRLNIVGTLPASGVLTFDWCTDSGAEGDATYNLDSAVTGDCDIPSINLSSTGTGSFSTSWGSYTYNVLVSSGTTVSQFFVKGATLVYTTADTTYEYVIDFINVDNACANPISETNYCVANCP